MLMVLCVTLVGALMTLGNHVADLDDRMVGNRQMSDSDTTIVEPVTPTTPPTTIDRCPNTFFLECT